MGLQEWIFQRNVEWTVEALASYLAEKLKKNIDDRLDIDSETDAFVWEYTDFAYDAKSGCAAMSWPAHEKLVFHNVNWEDIIYHYDLGGDPWPSIAEDIIKKSEMFDRRWRVKIEYIRADSKEITFRISGYVQEQ